jgi:NAD+ diphosphatase
MFEPSEIAPSHPADDDLWFSFRGDEILVHMENGLPVIPRAGTIHRLKLETECRQYLGSLDGTHCFAVGLVVDAPVPHGMRVQNLRRLHGLLGDEMFWIGGRAFQLISWDRTSRFCGRCGHAMEQSDDERAKVCPSCGFRNYPRISPAVIVAVTKGRRILLARASRFPYKLYSVIAGFVEPGETLEQCVRREIREEVNLEVKGIRYFGSQPWPFPNSLMIAFTAEYAGGRVRIDEKEIIDAGWFSIQEMPPIPDRVSIARRLIDSFIEKQRSHTR